MNANSVVVQQARGRPNQLLLQFHGVGATCESMLPLGRHLAAEFMQATVVSVASPDASGNSSGYQWFSVLGVTEENRPVRVAAAMPAFVAEIHAWQNHENAPASQTVLVGFSQGAIMALESTLTTPLPARTVVSIAGRFAKLPSAASSHAIVHLLHGTRDPVISSRNTVEAAQHLLALGGNVTADLPPAGHEINAEFVELTIKRLHADAMNDSASGVFVAPQTGPNSH